MYSYPTMESGRKIRTLKKCSEAPKHQRRQYTAYVMDSQSVSHLLRATRVKDVLLNGWGCPSACLGGFSNPSSWWDRQAALVFWRSRLRVGFAAVELGGKTCAGVKRL